MTITWRRIELNTSFEMVERERMSYVGQAQRFLIDFNLFETDDMDERTIHVQRWSTRVYICILFICMGILSVQHGLNVQTQLTEVKSPSLDLYHKLRNLYTDINCPCSQISVPYKSFTMLTPVYHPICSSGFISQIWIDMLFDNLTAFRYVGDFRATASIQFQTLRELCHFVQSAFGNDIQSFYEREFISGSLLSEDRWSIEIEATINAFLSSSFINVRHKVSFFRSFMIYNLFVPGIQTPAALLITVLDNTVVVYPQLNTYFAAPDGSTCACDEGGGCSYPSSFYNVTMFDNEAWIYSGYLQLQLSFVLTDWFVGCWALESLFISSFNHSFLTNQTELNLIATYFNWSSESILPIALNLTELNKTNQSSGKLDDLLQTSFVENMVTKLNYTVYFEQCRTQSCFYSVKQHLGFLYIITSLLGLYGGLSIALRFLIPYIVAFLINRLRRRTVVFIENVPTATNTWQQQMRGIVERLRTSLLELNLFESSLRRQPTDIKQQRWTSRIYILCLAFGLVVLTFYAMLSVQKKSIQLKQPALETVLNLQLDKEFNSSLQCPCTQINIPYGQIVRLQPFYHQVCSSDVVAEWWLSYIHVLLQVNSDLPRSTLDFRFIYQSFYLLSHLCDLIEQTMISSLEEFDQTQLVTSYLLPANIFENQMNSNIKKLQSESNSAFLRLFQLTRNISYINQYFTIANIGSFDVTYFHTATFSISGYSGTNDNISYSCSCANDINCKSQLGLYNTDYYSPQRLVPGLYRACFTLESLLQSTLECFYDDQDCYTNTIAFYNQSSFPTDFVRLNSSRPSRFVTNSTVGSLLLELFIEYWNQSLNYSSYFSLCQPTSCSYDILRRNSLLETVTIVLGLMGGLAISLSILVPSAVTVLVNVTRKRQQQQQQHSAAEILSLFRRGITFIMRIRNWFKQLNVFENPRKITGNNLEKQRRATYVYFFLLSVALCILVMYNSLAYSPYRFTVTSPSLEQYQQLQQQYGVDALNCPCSQVSMTYSSFLNFECDFHPVCTSQFISDSYLENLYEIYSELDILDATANAFTLQGTVFSHFQALRTLCNLVKDTYKDARQQYLTSSVIYASMIDYQVFDQQMNTSLARFNSALPDEFLSNLQLVRGMVQSNAFVSLYSTNWYPVINNWYYYANVYTQPQYYGDCNCLTSSSCTQQSSPFIQGYLVGCTPLESLLRSSIECLYEQMCIDLFTGYLNLSLPIPTPMNISETRFSQNDTVEMIIQQLFIESCSSNVSYSQFFDQCHPLSCTVTLIERNSMITIITILFGLYGGLTITLKLIVPFLVTVFYKIFRRRSSTLDVQVHPQPPLPSLS